MIRAGREQPTRRTTFPIVRTYWHVRVLCRSHIGREGGVLMPQAAAVTSPQESHPLPLEELLERGRTQGHLSLDEVRSAFGEAGITPAQGRSILRDLSEAGVRVASDHGPGS